MTRRALITGITGQDGSYLAELLLAKGYEVHGLRRRSSSFNSARVEHLYQDPHDPETRLFFHYADLTDQSRVVRLLREIQPDEIYHLAGQSHVGVSFEEPESTGDTVGLGAVRFLEAIRTAEVDARYYQASSSAMYGTAPAPQNEDTPFHPLSPYGVAKLFAHWTTATYREGYGMFAVSGILFNHESPRRGETFVTRKVSRAVARIQAGLQDYLYMGDLTAVRDWGYAPEYVEGMWRMLQADRSGGLRAGDRHQLQRAGLRRGRLRARRSRLGEARAPRRALPAPQRVGPADRRREQGRARARAGVQRCTPSDWSRSWSTRTSLRCEHEGRPWIDRPPVGPA